MLTDHYQQASARVYRNLERICEGYQSLWGDDMAVRVYHSMHDTDAPNAVALLGYPTDIQTEPTATGFACSQQFTVRVYVRTTHSDEAVCRSRASHLVEALQLMAIADPKLGYTVHRCVADVPEWQFGTDNSKLSTTVARIDFRCTVVTQNISEISALIADDDEEDTE